MRPPAVIGEQASKFTDAPPPVVVEVSISTLQVNFNRQTIASLIDFANGAFSASAPASPVKRHGSRGEAGAASSDPDPEEDEEGDVQRRKYALTVGVAEISVTLVKQRRYRLARIDVERASLRVDRLSTYNFMSGCLGSLSVTDLTSAGSIHSQIFTTSGDDVLSFEFVKRLRPMKGTSGTGAAGTPEDATQFQSHLKVDMSSIRYVHLRRFQTMMENYSAQFHEMQSLLAQMRQAAKGLITQPEQRENLHFEVHIHRPLVVIPRHSFSDSVIEADLGEMTISNSLRRAPPVPSYLKGTSADVDSMLDCVNVDIHGMNLYSSDNALNIARPSIVKPLISSNLDDTDELSGPEEPFSAIHREGTPISITSQSSTSTSYDHRKKIVSECTMNLVWDRNLSFRRRDLPNSRIVGHIADVHIQATQYQYDIIMGVLQENLGSESEYLIPEDWLQTQQDRRTEADPAASKPKTPATPFADSRTATPVAPSDRDATPVDQTLNMNETMFMR